MSVAGTLEARARSVRPGVWLAGIVVCSIAAQLALAHRIVAPWIFVDEIVYSDLAQSFAAHGAFALRGVPSSGYGPVYPLLIAPAWRLFSAMPSVYLAAKTINCVVMSLAAIPAYFLARRLLSVPLALVVAALTVMVPDMLYTGMIMTESAFYPLFLTVALLLQLTLERPTVRREAALLVVLVVAYETRAQAVALLAAIATAPVVFALLRREGLRPFALRYGVLATGAAVAFAATAARGESIQALLGAYSTATSSHYSLGGVLHYLVYHLAGFDLLTGVIPFAALVALWLSLRSGASRAFSAFGVTSLVVCAWLLLEVSMYASGSWSLRIEERYIFYLAPFAFIALLARASRDTPPLRARAVFAAAALAGVLPFFTDFAHFIQDSAISDTFFLLPWWWTVEHGLPLSDVRYVALGFALAAGGVFVLTPPRLTPMLAALVAVYLLAVTVVVENARVGIHVFSVGSLAAGTKLPHPDWIDRAVGTHASVAVLWTGSSTSYPIWEDGFFNRSLGTIYDLDGAPPADLLAEVAATRLSSGAVISRGRALDADYLLGPTSAGVAGRVVARDPIGYTLYRIDGPVIILTRVTGLYADAWSGKTVTYQRIDCAGGTLAVRLQSDPSLFHTTQTVIARELGRTVGRAQITPYGESTLTVPLQRAPGGRCTVMFTALHTAIPAQVEAGSIDTRVLGTRYLAFTYRP